ncbi:hypothetical protein COB55_03330 [Candidatus Wolfebacteria bacterium]|nr:MAG: hypothetical protein COB55_03330 [Candidatus Wolfebacteria bacterium]
MIHDIITNHIKRLYCILAIVFGILFAGYMYFVNSAVLQVVQRQTAEDTIRDLRAEVSELEFEYINSKNAITLTYAESQGFIAAKDTEFISRTHLGVVLDY